MASDSRDAAPFRTWVGPSGNGLFTAVSLAPGADRYRIHSWEVTGPGEGGGAPDSGAVDLVPTDQGVFCLDVVGQWQNC